MLRPRRETLGEAFVSEKVASLLSGIAQVREPVGTLHYGERVDVVGRRNDYVKSAHQCWHGWLGGSRKLMEPALWQRSIKLLDQTRGMPLAGAWAHEGLHQSEGAAWANAATPLSVRTKPSR